MSKKENLCEEKIEEGPDKKEGYGDFSLDHDFVHWRGHGDKR